MRTVAEFIRSHKMNGVTYPVGCRLRMRTTLFEELKAKNVVREYTGEYPPKTKTKFNLKDLK